MKANTDNRTEERKNRFNGESVMLTKEEEQCMEQLGKQADRIAKMFGFDKHWTT